MLAGVNAITHDSLFSQDTPDEEWLTHAGKAGWIVLTKTSSFGNVRSSVTP